MLPQLRPAILGGTLLVGLHCLSEFGAFSMLRFATFTTAIYDQYSSSFASAAANMLAVVLVACCLILVAGEAGLAGPRPACPGSGPVSARQAERPRWVLVQIPAVAFLALLVGAALAVPLSSVAYWLGRGSDSWAQALSTSLTTITLAGDRRGRHRACSGFPVAYLAVRYRSRSTVLMERLTYVAGALPSIVVALALITVTIRFARPIYQSVITLIAAYVLLFLPQGDGHPADRAAAGAARTRGRRPRARRRTRRRPCAGWCCRSPHPASSPRRRWCSSPAPPN